MSKVTINNAVLRSSNRAMLRELEKETTLVEWLEMHHGKTVDTVTITRIFGTVEIDVDVAWKEAPDGTG